MGSEMCIRDREDTGLAHGDDDGVLPNRHDGLAEGTLGVAEEDRWRVRDVVVRVAANILHGFAVDTVHHELM